MSDELELEIVIRCPPDRVWTFLDDVQEHARNPSSPVLAMEKHPPGPVRVGTRWREVIRIAPWVSMIIWSEVTGLETGRSLTQQFRGPWMRGTMRYEIEPAAAGVILRQRVRLVPTGLARPLAGPMNRAFGVRLARRLREIKDRLEAGLPGSAAAARR